MAGALFAFDQDRPSGLSVGPDGEARNDLWLTRTVRPRIVDDTGNVSWHWYLLDVPEYSTTVLADETTPTPTFSMDIGGTYRLRCVTNGGVGSGDVITLVCAATRDNLGTIINRNWVIPAAGEKQFEDNYQNQDRGWARALNRILRDILLNAFTGGGGGSVEGIFTSAPGVNLLDTVYLSAPATVDKALAISDATQPVLGIVSGTPAPGLVSVCFAGEIGGFTGMTWGADYFLSTTTPGGITTAYPAPGSTGQVLHKIGIAKNSTTLVITVDRDFIIRQ